MSNIIEDLKDKDKRIYKEDRKRFLALGIMIIVDLFGIVLHLRGFIELVTFWIIIWGTCGIFQVYNWIIHKRINKIIWEPKNL